jgi:Protein of unknown function (DUF3987)
MRPIDKFLEAAGDYSERGEEYRTKCPNHLGGSDDSLAIRELENGKVLLRCHAGCENEDIVRALGLEMGDLFSENGQARGRPVGPDPKKDQLSKTIPVNKLPGSLEEYFTFEDEQGNMLYVQRHKNGYFKVAGYDEDGDPLFRPGRDPVEPVLYGLVGLQEAIKEGKPAIHAEGCKDALRATEQLGVAGVTSGSCTSWLSAFAENYEGLPELWVIPDNDVEGHTYAHVVAQDLVGVVPTIKIVHLPDLEEGEDLSDFLDRHTPEAFFKVVEETPPLENSAPWPKKPAKLEVRPPPVDVFDEELLPEPLRGWVSNVARQMDNSPIDFAAIPAVVQAGAIIGKRMGVRPKAKSDWTCYPNLWGALVGLSGSMKTPAMLAALKPINRLGAKADEAFDQKMKEHKSARTVYEAKIAALDKVMKDVAKEIATGDTPEAELDVIQNKRDQLEDEEPEPPVRKRFHTSDTTVEQLGENLVNNPFGILLSRDELMGWLRTLDKPDRGSDRAFFLEGWTGDAEHLLDRVSRGYKRIPVVISICGGIQPGPLTKYVEEAIEDTGEKADGLLQRIQLICWPDHTHRRRTDIPPDIEARNKAYDVYDKLAVLDPKKFGATQEEHDDVPYVHFSPEAQLVYNQWYDSYEQEYRNPEVPPAIQAHVVKYRSLVPSLALVFEAVDYVSGNPSDDSVGPGSVGPENTLRAAAWCSYLQTHMERVYSPMRFTPAKRAHVLLEKIQRGEVRHGAKIRDVRRRAFPGLETVEHLREAADVLEALGWVRRVEFRLPGRGRPTEQLLIHPEERE